MTGKRFTVVCPGSERYTDDQKRQMRGDKHLHHPRGWETTTFPESCPDCGDQAQPRGAYYVMDLP